MKKICTKCKIEKNIDEFLKRKDRINGRYSFCNECRKLKSRKYSQTYREKIRCRRKRRIQLGLDPDFEGNYIHERKLNNRGKKNKYYYITKIGHPNAQKSNIGRIPEHVWIMSEFLNRPLYKNECVHHKNGLKYDNRLDNLELWTRAHPPGQRVDDKIAWCKKFLDEYGYDVIKR